MAEGFIDFHTHVLYGCDHGIQKKKDCVSMLEKYAENGFSTVVFTPHLFHPLVKSNVEEFENHFNEIKKEAQKLNLEVFLGCELYLKDQLNVLTIPIAGNYALCELPVDRKPVGLEEKIKQLTKKNLEPVIAHVERYAWMQPGDSTFSMLRDNGCWIQVNVENLETKKCMAYLEKNLVDIIASDNHGNELLPGLLAKSLREYENINQTMRSMI